MKQTITQTLFTPATLLTIAALALFLLSDGAADISGRDFVSDVDVVP